MPTYDYLCENCEHEFELFQSITAKPEKKCPECGKRKLKRLIGSGAGIIFKGSGFYETDYRSESYKAGHKAAKDSKSKTKDKKSDKKESGSESKAGAKDKPKSGGEAKAKKKDR